MADFGLFIGWGAPVRGREQNAAKVFNEAVELWTKLQNDGRIAGWQPVFLEPHGGDLSGFFLLWGERDAIAEIRAGDELMRLASRAQQIIESFGIVGAETGGRIQTQMQLFMEDAAELA